MIDKSYMEADHSFIFDKMPFAMSILDIERGTILYINDEYVKLLGYEKTELIGKKGSELDIMPPGVREKLNKILLLNGGYKYKEIELKTKTGGFIKGFLTGSYINLMGKYYLFEFLTLADAFGTIQDITERKLMEDEILKSHDRLAFTEEILNRAQSIGKTGSYYCNINTGYFWCSAGMKNILEIPPEQEVEKDYIESLAYYRDKAKMQYFFECMDNAVPCELECRLVFNNRIKWLYCISTVQKDKKGKPESITGTVIDITQRKKVEEEILKSREKLKQMEDTMLRSQKAGNVGSWSMDIKSLRIWGSDEAYNIFGTDKNLNQDTNVDILKAYIFKEDSKALMENWFTALNGKGGFDAEFRIKRRGEVRWIYCKAVIEKNINGQPVSAIGTILDITDRKITEEKLIKSEEKFRTVADWTYTWEYWLNTSDSIQYISPSCESISGYAREEFLADESLLISIIHPEDVNIFEKHFSDNYNDDNNEKSNGVSRVQFRIITKTGKIRWVDSICRRVYSVAGKYLGHRISNRDITLEKEAEDINREFIKAKELESLRNEFFANVSHELRMPLTIIFSSLQLLQPVIDDDELMAKEKESLKRHCKYIKQNCYRLLKLVNNLIDITKIEAGYMQLMLQPCDIVDIIKQISMSVEHYIQEKGIKLIFETCLKTLVMQCDPDKIERILLNLLSNAAKFTGMGGTIKVRLYSKNQRVCIEVEDTGEGIPKSKQSMIFERFHQVDQGFTRKHEGSGIGLSIVNTLVNMHGGSIRVHSDAGAGSVFIVELPVDMKNQQYLLNQRQGMKWYPKVFSVNVEFSDIYS